MRWPRLPPSYSVSELIGSSEESSLKPVLYGVVWNRTSSNTKNSASGPKYTVSPTPIDLTIASAFLAMPRGSRLYGSPVVGSSTSQVRIMVVSAKNGSMVAVTGSGIRHMSDSWIAFQAAIEEPSNIRPSAKVSSSIMVTSKVTCCHLPRGSVKRRSTYFTSLSLIDFKTSLAVFMITPFALQVVVIWPQAATDGSCSLQSGEAQYNIRVLANSAQMASSPDSPVLMRIASSMLDTKILPSPMRPV